MRGLWYCCDRHFDKDKARRKKDPMLEQGLGSPMRCGACKSRIPLLRRIRGLEYCSRQCFLQHGVELRPELPIELEYGGSKLRFPRRALLPMMGLGVIYIAAKNTFSTQVPLDFAFHGELPRPEKVSFETKVESWRAPDLNLWKATSESSPAWRLDKGVLQIVDTMLLSAQEAIAGTLSYRFSLSDRGSAQFLLASDQSNQRCIFIELLSNPTVLTLTPFHRDVDGAITKLGNSYTVDRGNKNLHDVSIGFDAGRIDVALNGASRSWSKLTVERGHVGLTSREKDDFRVYRADVALTT